MSKAVVSFPLSKMGSWRVGWEADKKRLCVPEKMHTTTLRSYFQQISKVKIHRPLSLKRKMF